MTHECSFAVGCPAITNQKSDTNDCFVPMTPLAQGRGTPQPPLGANPNKSFEPSLSVVQLPELHP
jgi:hypothetical protein